MKHLFIFLSMALIASNGCNQKAKTGIETAEKAETPWNGVSVSQDELLTWTRLGIGSVSKSGPSVALQESEDSKGIMLVSPDTYGPDVIIRYKVLALTPATVLVAFLSLSDKGESNELTIPEGYDGSLGLLTKESENYFFAFKNAPHNTTPFVKKSPDVPEGLIRATENSMIAGVFYDVELGSSDGNLWLTVDGEKIFETTDPEPLTGGHIALRIRGTTGFEAGCLIRDLEISGIPE